MARLTLEQMQAVVDRSPLNRWLGMRVVGITETRVELTMRWREELISNPDRQTTHGGILATLIDGAADYALAAELGRPVPTVDLQVDYFRAATPGDLKVISEIVHLGRTQATARADVYDMNGTLLCSGRGLYYVAKA